MGKIIYTKQLPAKITTHPTYLSFLLPFYLLVMLSMYKVQKCHTFFWSCTLSPFKNIFIFKVYLHHIRYNIAVRNHLCCIECINGAEHLGENTNNFKNSFSNKCCHRSVSIWSKNSGDRDWKLVWSVSFLSRTLNNLNRTYVLMIMKPWSFQHLLDHTGSSKRSV